MQLHPDSVTMRDLMAVILSLPDDQLPSIYAFALSLRDKDSARQDGIVAEQRAWGRLSVKSLAKEWDTPEEDEAWAYLQKDK